MKIETKTRIAQYTKLMPRMREKVIAAGFTMLLALIMGTAASFAWVTLSRAPVVGDIATTLTSNGSLEIALSKTDGSQPDEFDIDESAGIETDITVTNLRWGNLVNISDARYGIDNLALRPAQLNSAGLLTNPLWGSAYGQDGRVSALDQNFAYARYEDGDWFTSSNTYGVRAIASYVSTISDTTKLAQQEKINAVVNAHTQVNQKYSIVPTKFGAMGTMVSKYAQDKLDEANPGTNLAPYLGTTLELFYAFQDAMEAQKDAYVALANFQNYMYAQNTGGTYSDTTWEQIAANKAAYNAANADSTSTNGIVSLVGLTQYISDLDKLNADIGYLEQYKSSYESTGTPYYWGSGGISGHQISNVVADFIDYGTMTIDLDDNGVEVGVTTLSASNASSLLGANNKSRKVYTKNGIVYRFEQLAVDETYRLNGKAACTIKVTYILTITVNGKAFTKAVGPCYFSTGYNKAVGSSNLVANDSVAEDTYGMALDLWLRTNAEETKIVLEGATTTDEDGTIVSYDGVNRVWGKTGGAALTTDSTTQGGGSCYIYYADNPADQQRSLDLLEAMKVAFVDQDGNLLATAEMDTVNYYAVNGRITVPLVLEVNSGEEYTFTNEENEEVSGRAITSLKCDYPERLEMIVYLDGTMLGNDNVLSNSEIQGQLNVQFGSSEELKTMGNNELFSRTRSVSATVSKNTMNFDSAVTDDDLTTEITVKVDGDAPNTMTAFFLREITPTQGSREEAMTFVKQPSGDWTSSYKFTAPGTYYLRYIRMDGADFAIHEPPKVEIEGFGIRSLTWDEVGSSALVRTSESTYSERIMVEFATNDRSKMPNVVQARFVRAGDGVQVNVPLNYSARDGGKWVGTGTFSGSGEYELQFLIFDGKYKDLKSLGMSKTLTLSLGLYAEVQDATGILTEQYESGHTYERDVWVRIMDNAQNAIEGLEGVKLYFSNGGSATNTINCPLEWNENEGFYSGTLAITKAGKYKFSSLQVGSDSLTKCSESPTYTIISPDPPTYDLTSVGTFYGKTEFAPFTNDAVISGIKIANAESATMRAIVWNSISEESYAVSGDDFYSSNSGWVIKLPTYTLDLDGEGNPLPNAAYTQEGIWKVLMIIAADCYDTNAEFHDESNPIIWGGSDAVAEEYATNKGITPTERYNFSKLDTTVSCSANVSMTAGTTELGSSSADFMSRYPVSSTGMYVSITDDNGNVIPASKISDVTLSVSYTPPTANDNYGYKVLSSAAKTYAIKFNAQDAETGRRTVSEVNGSPDFEWQYVGEYKVTGLSVTLGNKTLTFDSDSGIGVPAKYTVTTKGPSSENIELADANIRQRNLIIGKTGDNVTGTFLQGGDPGVTAKVTLKTADSSDTQYVVLDDVSMQLLLTHEGGSMANGGYTINGSSSYENITLNMTNNSGTYATGNTALLAGTYAAKLKVTVGSVTTEKELSDIEVYSKQPTVKVTGVTPNVNESFDMNSSTDFSESGSMTQYVEETIIKGVQNFYSDTLANVYIKAEKKVATAGEGDGATNIDTVAYTLPEVKLALSDVGSAFSTAVLTVPNATDSQYNVAYEFTPSNLSLEKGIGGIKASTYKLAVAGGCNGENLQIPITYKYEAGDQIISSITMTDGKNNSYQVNLSDSIHIRETCSAPPSITFQAMEGYTTTATTVSEDGGAFTYTLPMAIGTTTANEVEVAGGSGWGSPISDTIVSKLCYVELAGKATSATYQEGSGCSATTKTYYKQSFNYHLYERHQYVYEQTSGTTTYAVTKGLTGWNVGGTVYEPGAKVTVSSPVTAIPVIGTINKVVLNKEEATVVHTTQMDVSVGTSTVTSDNHANDTAAKAQKDYSLPTGYNWFNPSTPTSSAGILTEETQYGSDYTR